MFFIIIPGYPIITEFLRISYNQWAFDLPNPLAVTTLTFGLTAPLLEGLAACLSWSAAPFESYSETGTISNSWPSDCFYTP